MRVWLREIIYLIMVQTVAKVRCRAGHAGTQTKVIVIQQRVVKIAALGVRLIGGIIKERTATAIHAMGRRIGFEMLVMTSVATRGFA